MLVRAEDPFAQRHKPATIFDGSDASVTVSQEHGHSGTALDWRWGYTVLGHFEDRPRSTPRNAVSGQKEQIH